MSALGHERLICDDRAMSAVTDSDQIAASHQVTHWANCGLMHRSKSLTSALHRGAFVVGLGRLMDVPRC